MFNYIYILQRFVFPVQLTILGSACTVLKNLHFVTNQQPGPYYQIDLYDRFEPGSPDPKSNALNIRIIEYEEMRKKEKKK